MHTFTHTHICGYIYNHIYICGCGVCVYKLNTPKTTKNKYCRPTLCTCITSAALIWKTTAFGYSQVSLAFHSPGCFPKELTALANFRYPSKNDWPI